MLPQSLHGPQPNLIAKLHVGQQSRPTAEVLRLGQFLAVCPDLLEGPDVLVDQFRHILGEIGQRDSAPVNFFHAGKPIGNDR